MCDKADAAGVMFVGGIVQSLGTGRLRHGYLAGKKGRLNANRPEFAILAAKPLKYTGIGVGLQGLEMAWESTRPHKGADAGAAAPQAA
jgi:hypothetical protein